jgi:phosphoribosylanthranilate isomerase
VKTPVQFKICGLTSASDAREAARLGASFLGFNLYPPSPRHVTLPAFRAFAPGLPQARRVAVLVEPDDAALADAADAGFDLFQVHFRHDAAPSRVDAWSAAVGAGRLWLAPRLPPGTSFRAEWLPLAHAFMLDSYDERLFGGSGRPGNWAGFSVLRAAHPDHTWILAGGLDPSNAARAVRESGAAIVDVCSGVETSPGIKDAAKMAAFAAAIAGLAA